MNTPRVELQKRISMQPVESSHIEAVGHDAATGTLSVTFKGGRTYHMQASAEEHQAFLDAESPGKHFHRHFRGREAVRL